MNTATDTDRELARILWRCRRGLLELDLVLGGFARSAYVKLNEAERKCFRSLLETPDQQLLEWLQEPEKCTENQTRKLLKKVIQVIDNKQ